MIHRPRLKRAALCARAFCVSALLVSPTLFAAEDISDEEKKKAATALDAVKVSGVTEYGFVARQTGVGSKTDTPLIETPQSVSIVTREELDVRNVQTLVQAAAYSPGVQSPYPDPNGSWLYFRGFFSSQYLDGLRIPYSSGGGAATMQTEIWGIERVEMLRGPASVMYGQNAPGGISNVVSKRPTLDRVHNVQLQAGSYGKVQGAFDVGGRIDDAGVYRYRIDGLVRDAGTRFDHGRNDRRFIAPSISWNPSDQTSLTLLTQYLKEDLTPRNWLPGEGTLLPNPNGKVSVHRYTGDPAFNQYTREQTAVGYALDHRFTDWLSLKQNFRYTDVHVHTRSVAPGFNGFSGTSKRLMSRTASEAWREGEATALDTHLEADFATGPLDHLLIGGVDYSYYSESAASRSGTATPIDVFTPVYGAALPSTWTIGTPTRQTQRRTGSYLQDQISYDRWRLTLAGRYEDVSTQTINRATGLTTAKLNDHAFTTRAGLLYLADNGLAPYVSYSESFEPLSGVDFYGAPFQATKGKQNEIGVRYQPVGSNLLLSAALFDLRQVNNLMTDYDPTHTCNGGGPLSCSVQSGEYRSRGVELEAKYSVNDALNLTAAYTRNNSSYTKANLDVQGKEPTGLSPNAASVWANYTVQAGPLAGLGFGGGARYTGWMWMDSANTRKIPGYTLMDALLRYDMGQRVPALHGMRIALNVTNVLNKETFPGICSVSYCLYGEGRTVNATLDYRW
ncbi:iron complex outermembrane receptor protein [Luteibacter sp. Sphag1AF]|uniref:TonB-dependent siderophore receptor n=1 Tax=Luteibacter sp. Sphag1AF TaxID=2587031 RepID=UPI0016169829|nr:TonB-dependent siderophore receptor [Luteibacter sp. Sphag1AF]MBB3228083.1 iron complex outermembrane receptor protein [Luteibacter sp. Sphag1AF]